MKVELKKVTEPDGQQWYGVYIAEQIQKVYMFNGKEHEEEQLKKAIEYYDALCNNAKRREETIVSTEI